MIRGDQLPSKYWYHQIASISQGLTSHNKCNPSKYHRRWLYFTGWVCFVCFCFCGMSQSCTHPNTCPNQHAELSNVGNGSLCSHDWDTWNSKPTTKWFFVLGSEDCTNVNSWKSFTPGIWCITSSPVVVHSMRRKFLMLKVSHASLSKKTPTLDYRVGVKDDDRLRTREYAY